MSLYKPQTKTLCCPKCEEVQATLETFIDRFDHELEWQEYVCPHCEHVFEDVYEKCGDPEESEERKVTPNEKKKSTSNNINSIY